MAATETTEMALAVEEGKVRDLYNALRTGDHGVSLEALAQSLYFLQHAEFTLFDVKDAFRSSTCASERFLAYREFQIALCKIARVKYYGNCGGADESVGSPPKQHPRPTDLELMCSLVDQLTNARHHNQLDTLRCQMTRCSAINTLEHNLPALVQSFQLYGLQNRLSTSVAASMLSAITLDGFVDFLNAYFEYEEFFSFDDLARMCSEVLSGFTRASTKAEAKDRMGVPNQTAIAMNFAQFLELICRVACALHHKLLVGEGVQLRRAVESCRLEFSLEVLLDHMNIKLIPNEESIPATSNQQPQEVSTITSGVKNLAPPSSQSPRGADFAAMVSIVQNIRDVLRLEAADSAISTKPKYRIKREGSLATVGQLSRRPSGNPEQTSSGRSTPGIHSTDSQPNQDERPKSLPRVAMIREIVMPPALPSDVIQLLESALKFQNMAQYHMALSTLDFCKQRYQEQYPPPNVDQVDPIWTEVQLFFTLQAASVYDSAHRDSQALTKYYEAMKLARQLPASHPGRLLVKSCVGVTLFYAGELALAQQCHQLVLDARKSTKRSARIDAHNQPDKRAPAKSDGSTNSCALVDTATAMNNVACCLSQDQSASTSKSLDNAYLLFKHARQIYADAFGPAHPRVELIGRNLDRVRACQNGVVSDAAGALARGEYAHVIPGSTFQIKALEVASKSSKSSSGKSGKSGGKKKKKGAK
ncbi:hypothetical protein PI124_g1021 [Phytophthora idaei]|nr:hypothetical protein PI125_g20282 [Phytophthora idaei]KAG3134138.1 hypothetical protein PI126_g18834 [Phytophthora idaei]KAG3254368.1 hypothetical protein PI124_g1021 [Phytophthora idaei]